jgi:hypothetical protein
MVNSAYKDDAYSGRSSFYLRLSVSRAGVSGNSTSWSWTLRAYNSTNTKQTYNLDNHSWSANIEGSTYSGNAILDFRGGQDYIQLGSGTTGYKAHDANGNLTVNFSASHNNVGLFGSASLSSSFAADRLPTLPNAPVMIGLDQATPSSFRYRFSSNGGGTASSWQVQYSLNSDYSSATTITSSGTSTISGLTAGAKYYVRARGVNSFGNGAYGATGSITLPLGAPTLNSFTQNASGGLVASWSAPSPSTGLTGYRLQIATNSGFTTGVQNIELGNVLTYTKTGLSGGRLYYARVAAVSALGVNAYSDSMSKLLVLSAGDIDGWTRVGTKPSAISYYTDEGIRRGTVGTQPALWLESLSTGAVTLAADTFGIQKVLTGLTVGKAYRFVAKATLSGNPSATQYKLQVVAESTGTATTVTVSGVTFPVIEFVADATSVTLRILLGQTVTLSGATDEVEKIGFTNIQLLELATDYPQRLRATVYESNLANHFDLACNSVGASWYVDAAGTTKFRLPGAYLPVEAIFSDQVDPSAVHYVDIVAGYDTKLTVNRIEGTNYGTTEEDGTEREENDELFIEDTASISTFGLYRANLSVNMYDEAPYDESFSDRLNELLTLYKTPHAQVSEIRWNAQENLALAQSLEVGMRVRVDYRGQSYDVQIVNISHDITPTRWMVTLTLQQL